MARSSGSTDSQGGGTTNADWWQYSRWMVDIARFFRNSPNQAEGAIETAIDTFLAGILVERPWLIQEKFEEQDPLLTLPEQLDLQGKTRLLKVFSKNLKNIAINDAEVVLCDALFAITSPIPGLSKMTRFGVSGDIRILAGETFDYGTSEEGFELTFESDPGDTSTFIFNGESFLIENIAGDLFFFQFLLY